MIVIGPAILVWINTYTSNLSCNIELSLEVDLEGYLPCPAFPASLVDS